jgi:hypothetical protein
MVFRQFRRRPLLSPAERSLQRVQRLILVGRFGQAAALLAGLANQVETAGRPRAAAELHARAAHCYVEGGIASAALAEASSALLSFKGAGMSGRFTRFDANITRKMQAHGMQAGVEALRAQFGAEEIEFKPELQAAAPGRRLILPAACPQCGAPVRGDEVEWIDEHSVECAYCGAVIEAQ